MLEDFEFAKLAEWFKTDELFLNVSKTYYMPSSTSKKKKPDSGLRSFIGDGAIT